MRVSHLPALGKTKIRQTVGVVILLTMTQDRSACDLYIGESGRQLNVRDIFYLSCENYFGKLGKFVL